MPINDNDDSELKINIHPKIGVVFLFKKQILQLLLKHPLDHEPKPLYPRTFPQIQFLGRIQFQTRSRNSEDSSEVFLRLRAKLLPRDLMLGLTTLFVVFIYPFLRFPLLPQTTEYIACSAQKLTLNLAIGQIEGYLSKKYWIKNVSLSFTIFNFSIIPITWYFLTFIRTPINLQLKIFNGISIIWQYKIFSNSKGIPIVYNQLWSWISWSIIIFQIVVLRTSWIWNI